MGFMSSGRAYANLVELFKVIRGAPYYTDLGGRVYRRLLVPGDTRLVMPYLCLVMTGEPVQYEEDEGRGLRVVREVALFGFCPEPSNTEVNGVAADRCLDLHDDILKAWLADQTLQGAAYSTKWTGGSQISGMTETYAELQMRLQIVQWLCPEGIGP